MNPQRNIKIPRSPNDTDPVYMKLQTSNNNVVTQLTIDATVTMLLEDSTSLTGTYVANGIFSFDLSNVNTTNSSLHFDVNVEDNFDYRIAEGTINFY